MGLELRSPGCQRGKAALIRLRGSIGHLRLATNLCGVITPRQAAERGTPRWWLSFYTNQRGKAEQYIKEGKNAIKWTRLSCRTFRDNAVQLQLHALAHNLANFMRTLALPKEVEHWSLTTLREKLVKIGAKVVSHGRSVTFQLAEVAVPRSLFQNILSLIDDLRRRPVPASAEGLDGEVKSVGEVRLDGGKYGKMAFRAMMGPGMMNMMSQLSTMMENCNKMMQGMMKSHEPPMPFGKSPHEAPAK